jgi:hypothetical protein
MKKLIFVLLFCAVSVFQLQAARRNCAAWPLALAGGWVVGPLLGCPDNNCCLCCNSCSCPGCC